MAEMISVPYEDFINGTKAVATLDIVKRVLEADKYCADELRDILSVNLKEKSDAGAD